MKYEQIVRGEFVERPNRFIAYVNINGKQEIVHVKNTGRCRELLVPGAVVYLEKSDAPERKTAYDLVAVEKVRPDGTTLLINMDSQAPNEIAAEGLPVSRPFPTDAILKREVTRGDSRFDFAVTAPNSPMAYVEVKGCTLEREGIAYFPDAPTERGVKHIRELTALAKAGHPTAILFVVQMKKITALRPNDETHPAFGDALREAGQAGVQILAVDCRVNALPVPDGTFRLSVTADAPVFVEL